MLLSLAYACRPCFQSCLSVCMCLFVCVSMSLCVRLCLYVQALTFEPLYIATSFLLWRYTILHVYLFQSSAFGYRSLIRLRSLIRFMSIILYIYLLKNFNVHLYDEDHVKVNMKVNVR